MMSFGNKKNLTIFKPNWERKSRILWGQIGILSGKTKIFEEKNQNILKRKTKERQKLYIQKGKLGGREGGTENL